MRLVRSSSPQKTSQGAFQLLSPCLTERQVTTALQAREQVAAALTALHVPHTLQLTIHQGLLPIDVALGGAQVAMQVDGSEAFSSNEPHWPLGDTKLAWRLLRLQGWQVRAGYSLPASYSMSKAAMSCRWQGIKFTFSCGQGEHLTVCSLCCAADFVCCQRHVTISTSSLVKWLAADLLLG